MSDGRFPVGNYELSADVAYDRDGHFWVSRSAGTTRARIGFDPLGHETSGDIVAVSFSPEGTALSRGGSFGTLEAAKYVGPLKSPVAGSIVRHNKEVAANPGLIAKAPFDHWLIEVELADADAPDGLLRDHDEICSWFAAEIKRFDEDGMIAL